MGRNLNQENQTMVDTMVIEFHQKYPLDIHEDFERVRIHMNRLERSNGRRKRYTLTELRNEALKDWLRAYALKFGLELSVQSSDDQ